MDKDLVYLSTKKKGKKVECAEPTQPVKITQANSCRCSYTAAGPFLQKTSSSGEISVFFWFLGHKPDLLSIYLPHEHVPRGLSRYLCPSKLGSLGPSHQISSPSLFRDYLSDTSASISLARAKTIRQGFSTNQSSVRGKYSTQNPANQLQEIQRKSTNLTAQNETSVEKIKFNWPTSSFAHIRDILKFLARQTMVQSFFSRTKTSIN